MLECICNQRQHLMAPVCRLHLIACEERETPKHPLCRPGLRTPPSPRGCCGCFPPQPGSRKPPARWSPSPLVGTPTPSKGSRIRTLASGWEALAYPFDCSDAGKQGARKDLRRWKLPVRGRRLNSSSSSVMSSVFCMDMFACCAAKSFP
jgi:hypothetical protein